MGQRIESIKVISITFIITLYINLIKLFFFNRQRYGYTMHYAILLVKTKQLILLSQLILINRILDVE